MTIKSLLTLLITALILFCTAFFIKCESVSKDDVIIKQNNKEIIARKYKTYVSINKNLKSFNCEIDSSLWKYPQNKVIYDGIIIKAQHEPHEVLLRVTVEKIENNKKYKIKTIKNVTEFFSCSQISEFENNLGKRMVITKTYFPTKRIFYKFP